MKTARKSVLTAFALTLVLGIAGFLASKAAFAHCDTMDGPVIIEAKAALEKGDVTPVLKWVKKEHEEEIKSILSKVLSVRSKDQESKEIADRYFLETLIRLHREGEGAPFTGLKPAGTIEPSVAEADKAIDAGSVDELAGEIGQAAEKAIQKRFARLMDAKKHKDESVEKGREYVRAYVEYVHFVEALHNMTAGSTPYDGHGVEKGITGHSH